ncbi:MAG: PIN domain-containing protein [Sphingopyxis sp.]
MILVDTNVWSVATRAQPDAHVVDWLGNHKDLLWLSPVVIAEIRYGYELLEPCVKREILIGWLAGLEDEYRERTLSFDADAGHALGRLLLQKPQEAKLLDTLLAAQALSRDCPIATRNVKDFEWAGTKVINPWEQ